MSNEAVYLSHVVRGKTVSFVVQGYERVQGRRHRKGLKEYVSDKQLEEQNIQARSEKCLTKIQ